MRRHDLDGGWPMLERLGVNAESLALPCQGATSQPPPARQPHQRAARRQQLVAHCDDVSDGVGLVLHALGGRQHLECVQRPRGRGDGLRERAVAQRTQSD